MTASRSPSVLLLSTNLARGGAETQVALLAMALRRRGWRASVVSLITPSAFEKELADAGVPVWSPHMQPGRIGPIGGLRLLEIVRKARPEIMHAHMFHANFLARLLRAVCPVPVLISTIHSAAETGRSSSKVKGRDWLYRASDVLSDATVCVSDAVAERHVAAGAVSRRRLHVIPNGVDLGRFRANGETRSRIRKALGIGNEFVWLAVGRLMWKKDYATMLGAMARQREGVLLIAGEGPLDGELRTLASNAGGNVRFLGLRDDVADLMCASDGFVLSSVVEGLPMVLIEAAASGLPAVATDVGGVREAVIDGQTGIVVPAGEPATLSSAMTRLMAMSADERKRMGDAACEHATACFSLDAVVSKWEQLYLDRLESARSPLKP